MSPAVSALSDYVARHDEHGLILDRRIRNFKPHPLASNYRTTIYCNTLIKTVVKISANKPDLLIIDKHNRSGLIVEVGWGEEIKKVHNLHSLDIVPMIWSWEGVVSTRHIHLSKLIGITKHVEGYIQSRILKRTLDTFLSDSRRIRPDPAVTGRFTELADDPEVDLDRLKLYPNPSLAPDRISKTDLALNDATMDVASDVNASVDSDLVEISGMDLPLLDSQKMNSPNTLASDCEKVAMGESAEDKWGDITRDGVGTRLGT
ncbi:MAG: hypothetical protein MHPSP_002453, partial [Paramarteilia canceri]